MRIQYKLLLTLLAVIVIFVATVNYLIVDVLAGITRTHIRGAVESSVSAYQRYEVGRRDLFLARVTAMVQVAHLKATLMIPNVDHETLQYAGASLREIADVPLILILDPNSSLSVDVNASGATDGDVASLPNISDVVDRGVTTYGASMIGGTPFRVAVAPVVSGPVIAGFVVIGEPFGADDDIDSLAKLSSVNVAFVLGDELIYPSNLNASVADSLTSIAIRDDNGAQEVATPRGSYFVDTAPVGSIGAIAFFASHDAYAADLIEIRKTINVASIVVVLLGALLSLRVASKISSPLDRLTKAAKAFGRGQLDHQVSIDSQDEIGTLASAFSAMARDIQHQREELIDSKQAAEASSQAKSTFLATMSHEIRTPLNGVIGIAELLQQTSLTPKQTHYCNTICKSSKSLLGILNNVLDLSKIEAGRLSIDLVPTDLEDLVRESVYLFEESATAKGLQFLTDVASPSNKCLLLDKTRIRQVLTNLLSNAVKFTNDGSVGVSVTAIENNEHSVTLRFEVTDTGIGMDAETQSVVFESFRQADGSMSRRYGGTGLGLTISRLIVDLLGGELRVESRQGTGSRFWFDVPADVVSEHEADLYKTQTLQLDRGRFSGLTAMLVEDNPVNQEVARESLILLGIDVVVANNGQEAIELFSEVKPSFVLMDCQMPGVDGYEATRAIRKTEAAASELRTPIIALTANALSGDADKCFASGMDDFIGKPFTLPQLQTTIRKWFADAFIPETSPSAALESSTDHENDIDREVLESLRSIGRARDNNLLKNVLTMFLDRAPVLVEQIKAAIDQNDVVAIRETAHALKSSSANVGARRLSQLASEIETAARHDQVVTGAECEQLEHALATVAPQLAAVAADTPSRPGSALSPKNDAKAKTVLVVDDDDTFRLTIAEALVDAGYDVINASTGHDAIRLAQDQNPDCVLLDAVMPELDGFEICGRLQANSNLANVPVIMVTGLNDRVSVDLAFQSGASAFITKPIEYSVLGHHVRFVIRANETARALRESESRLTTAQRLASLGYWVWNVETGSFTASDELLEICEKTALDALEAFEAGVADEDRENFRRDVDRVIEERVPLDSTYRIYPENGSAKYVHQHLCVNTDDTQGLVLVATVQDVTARRTAEERVRHLAYYDPLTGLASRTYLYERITEMIKSATRRNQGFDLLFLDLDGFKDVNDTLGHSEGDTLLKIVAERLKASLRGNDFLARFGGDEFCMILEDTQSEFDTRQIAARCLDNIQASVDLKAHPVKPRASIGIARFPSDGTDLSSLLRAADSACYEAKANGKHRFEFFDAAMAIRAERRFVLTRELRDALQNEEFELYYQPQVALSDGNVAAFEALVRWNHPTRGLVPPSEFIGELERLGLIDELGSWAIRRACRQIAQWREAGTEVKRVCVNIAATHFQNPALTSDIDAALHEFDVHASMIELEVTESALQYTEGAIEVLEKLKEMGIAVAIDDFGSGYSSFGSLQHMSVDCLKIDRMFVRDLLTSPRDAVLLGTIMSLAHALGFSVVAEGVEEQQQVQILAGLGCDLVQGYYFSEPVPSSSVPSLSERAFLPPATNVVQLGSQK